MKTYHIINTPELPYPIARNLTKGLPIIKKMLLVLYKFIKKNYSDKNRIVFFCRGSSGAIIAGLAADYFMHKGYEVFINHIKKEGEKSHHGAVTIYGSDLAGAITVIIDDFISSGETVINIVDKTQAVFGNRKNIKFDILCITGNIEKLYGSEMVIFNKLPIDNVLCG